MPRWPAPSAVMASASPSRKTSCLRSSAASPRRRKASRCSWSSSPARKPKSHDRGHKIALAHATGKIRRSHRRYARSAPSAPPWLQAILQRLVAADLMCVRDQALDRPGHFPQCHRREDRLRQQRSHPHQQDEFGHASHQVAVGKGAIVPDDGLQSADAMSSRLIVLSEPELGLPIAERRKPTQIALALWYTAELQEARALDD